MFYSPLLQAVESLRITVNERDSCAKSCIEFEHFFWEVLDLEALSHFWQELRVDIMKNLENRNSQYITWKKW